MRLRFIYFCFALLLSANSVLAQTVSSVTYNAFDGTLSVTGENFQSLDPDPDIDATKITITGNGGAPSSYTLGAAYSVNIISSTNFIIDLNDPEKAAVDNILNRNGLFAWDNNNYRIDFASTWNSVSASATFSAIDVTGVVTPEITSASFSFGNGRLTINGINLNSLAGTNNDIDVTKLTIGNGTSSYTLTSATTSGDLDASSVIVYLTGIDKAMVNYILNSDGVNAISGNPYNLSASAGWNGLSEADLTSNSINVTGYQKPQVSNATYDASSGILRVFGSFFAAAAGVNNDVDITKLQIYGYGPATYTLSQAANPDIIDETNFEILLTGADKTQAGILLNRNGLNAWDGTVYSLNLADTWNSAISGIVDFGNAINVSGVLNHAPQARTPNIAGNFINGEPLLFSYTYFDFEGDEQGLANIQWFTYTSSAGDGKTPISGATGATFTLRAEDIGLYINAEITPTAVSGATPGLTAGSPIYGPVLNAAPYASGVSITGDLYLNRTATGVFIYNDREGNPVGTCTYKWYRASNINGPDILIPDETNITYEVTSGDLNNYISFEVTPVSLSGTLTGEPVRSSRFQILNEAPIANTVTFTGNMYRGQVLTGSYAYSDLEGDQQGATTFQWYRADDIAGPDVAIVNATASTYTLTLDDLDKYISFVVTPRALTGSQTGSATFSSRALVLNERPKAVSVYISGNMYLNQDISGNYTYTDLENNPQGTSTFKWFRADSENGPDIEIPGATQSTYRITTDDLNKYLSFTVWPVASSGTPNGDPVQSVRLAVKNEKPKASLVDFTGDIYLSRTVSGIFTFSDLENDGQGPSTFKWYRADNINGPDVEIIGATQSSYTITSADLNKYISFEVTPVALSGTLQGDPVKSPRKAVLNEAPKGSLLKVTGNLILGQVILADYVYSDLENDMEGSSEFQWFIADEATGPDSPVSGAVSKTFTITRPYLGKYLSYTVIPKALTGNITGDPVTSDRFYVNAAPTGTNISISGIFKLKQELQGIFTYSDAENNQEGISAYHWYRANSPEGLGKEIIVGANTKNYTIQSEDMNKYLSFEYTPKAISGSIEGLPVASPFMGPVTNSEPVATNVRISGTQLVCKTIRGEYNFEDLEGDPEGNSQYRWLRAASASGAKTVIPGAIGREYILTTQDQGMYLFFEVVPRAISGTTTGTATLSSPTGSIVNALPTVTILGTSSICSGSAARLTISFTGSAPWKLTYSDGTERYQIVSSDPVYFLNVSKAGTYKGDTLTDNIGCPVTELPSSATVSILPLPDVQIVGLNNAYNYRGNPVALTGSPAGGTFSGPGVIPSTSMFYPSIAGTQNSPHTIIYEYRSPQTGCQNRDTAIVEVIDADASISGLRDAPSKYCNFDQSFIITGTNAIGTTGTFAITGGIGLTDNNNNTATIRPELLQAGSYTISYSYFDGIQLSIYKDFSIEVLDEARIFGINSNQYCSNSAPIEVSGNYNGGVFSGNAIFKNVLTNKYYFNPSLDTPGNSSVTYTYSTSYGCVISKSVEKYIAPVPVAEFALVNGCYNGDSTAFKNNTISTANIHLWSWQFGDPQSTEANNRSALFEPKHKYSAIGNRNVRLIAENIYGCKDTVIKSIHLGDIPKAAFSWNSECYVKGSPFSFKNKTTNVDDIIQYSWAIEDTSSLNFNYASRDILHTFPVIRDYWVKLKVISEYGCSDSIKKTISLRPIHYLKDTLYSNNFEAGKGYWLPTDSLLTNNWRWGTPDGNKIKNAAEGSKAFFTSLKDIRKNQQLVITSPCFNFKDTDRPYITMETFTDAQKGEEGTVLQYTVNNGEVWENLGGFKTGINWYNDFAIQSQPAGQQIGWTDRYLNWANARHNLDFLKNDTLVRFRMVFGQSSKSSATDGFAFDNIIIANRSKKVLFEHFTNNSQPSSIAANAYLDSVVSENKNDAIAIQYHTSFPGIDTFNIHNPSDPGSRVLYYGIGVTPLALLDGNEANYKYDFSVQKKPNSNDIKNLALKDNIFDLKIKVKITQERVNGSLHIKALKAISGKTISARIVVLENIVTQSDGYQKIYSNVVKKILPSAGGHTISQSWEKGKADSINFSWDSRNIYNAENISVVAFLQDEMTREIYQVTIDDTSSVIIGTGKKIKNPEKEWQLKLYPNPAKEWLAVEFPEIENDNMRIEIWSIGGKAVVSEKLLKGVGRYEKEIQNLQNGFYFIRIFDGYRVLATKKFIVAH